MINIAIMTIHFVTAVNSETNTINHKAVMKQEVADWFIEKFTTENDIIYDPFMGLGTTAIACKKYGRDCKGTELSEQYYNIALERINNA